MQQNFRADGEAGGGARAQWAKRHPALAREERTIRKALVAARKDFGHKRNGTIETHAHAARQQQGAMARLYASGHLTIDELARASEIAGIAAKIGADVSVRTCSLETRVDGGARAGAHFHEALGAVWGEMTYSRWRAQLGGDAGVVLDMIVRDTGIGRAAAAHHMHARRARRLLTQALENWARIHHDMRQAVSAADVAAAQAGLI